MVRRKAAKRGVEARLARLRARCRDEDGDSLRAALVEALRHEPSLVAARAAREVAARGWVDLGGELGACFRRFLQDPVRSDPGCAAKEACLEAVARLEVHDLELFQDACRFHQPEPSWGPPVDTATSVRARALTALAAAGAPEFLVLAGDLLADEHVPVRLAAVDSIVLHGSPDGAGLLLLAARRGEDEPEVLGACLAGAVRLSPALALPRLEAMLQSRDPVLRDSAGIALGECPSSEAAVLLIQCLETVAVASERAPLLRALGFHRSEAALEALRAVIAEGSLGDATEALRALEPRAGDPRVLAAVEAAVGASGRIELEDLLAQLF